ncbi:MAG: prepilin-type N-terminal cleavage/methylation domain-containing protein, partial [Bacteroidota bacterium]
MILLIGKNDSLSLSRQLFSWQAGSRFGGKRIKKLSLPCRQAGAIPALPAGRRYHFDFTQCPSSKCPEPVEGPLSAKKGRVPLQTITQSLIRKKFVTGFTLFELLIVISIIMIVLGLSKPLFRKTFSDIKLSATVSDIVSLMRYAQERAIVQGVVFRLNFDTEKGEYWLTKAKQEDSKSMVTFENVPGKFGRHLSVSEDLTIVGLEASSIDFYPDGEISQGKVTLNNT